MTIWELRFSDGRGASFYTEVDVSDDIGAVGEVRRIDVAASVFGETALRDAATCFREGRVVQLSAHLGSIAYALRHEVV